MIDSIKLVFPMTMTNAQLNGWRKTEREQKNRFVYREHILEIEIETGAVIKASFSPTKFNKSPGLSLEFSLPKLLTGDNLVQLEDIHEAMEQTNEILGQVEQLPKVNVFAGILTRLDIMFDHNVGNLLPAYIDGLSRLDHPYRKTHPYLRESVYYNSDKTVLKFYDKFAESEDERARGLLRQEQSLLDTRTVHKRMGTNSLAQISPEVIERELNRELQHLRLNEVELASEAAAAIRLVEKYGYYEGLHYTALRSLNGRVDIEELIPPGAIHHRSLDRHIRKIIDAGIALVSTDYDGFLPPLEVNIGFVSDLTDGQNPELH